MSSEAHDAAFTNMQTALAKHQEDAAAAATAHEHAMAKVLTDVRIYLFRSHSMCHGMVLHHQ